MKGKFITIEGVEGVGKTTNIDFIHGWLNQRKQNHIVTREPGGTPLAEDIRTLLLTPRDEAVSDTTELLLMFAARAQHLNEIIKPALAAGKWVICDRFTDATYAYQGGGRNQDQQHIAQLEQLVQGNLRPDLTLILDMDVETGLRRVHERGQPDRFERERHEFFDRVRDVYLSRAKQSPERCKLIDASQPLEAVQADIARVLQKFAGEDV